MVNTKVKIINVSGLHLRPAGILCNEAIRYQASIRFRVRGDFVNAKSVLSVLGACVKNGDELEFFCDGEDEQEALAAMVRLIGAGLGE